MRMRKSTLPVMTIDKSLYGLIKDIKVKIDPTPEQQRQWDECLLRCWINEKRVYNAIKNFCMIEIPEKTLIDKEYIQWFFSLNLKRVPKWFEKDEPAKCFIGKYSFKLSAYLIGDPNIEAIIPHINSFPWTQPPKANRKKYQQKAKTDEVRMTIDWRKMSSTQWNKVK